MDEIYRTGGVLDLAITLPDDKARAKAGRVYLDAFCEKHGVPLVKSPNVNDASVVKAIRTHKLDWLFIIGWSQIARSEILRAPARGVLGMHPTLLPEGRGRAAIPWAILKGLERTGVTMFQLDEGVDTGPILAQKVLPLSARETATSLYQRVTEAHRQLMAEAWPQLAADRIVPRPQDERLATVWPGRTPEDGRILPQSMTVEQVDRLVRASTRPYPGAFLDKLDRRIRIWAGRPGTAAARQTEDEVFPVRVRDGIYVATDFEFESL